MRPAKPYVVELVGSGMQVFFSCPRAAERLVTRLLAKGLLAECYPTAAEPQESDHAPL